MERYRYRTSVLVGPWRDRPEWAAADAVRSNQARMAASDAGLTWLVPGEIEAGDGESEAGAEMRAISRWQFNDDA